MTTRYRVTCLLNISTDEPERVFASRSKFWSNRAAAEEYAATIAPSRKPQVVRLDQTASGKWMAGDDKVVIGNFDDELTAALAYDETVTRVTF